MIRGKKVKPPKIEAGAVAHSALEGQGTLFRLALYKSDVGKNHNNV